MVREGFTVDVASTTLRGVKSSLLQHNFALANYHHRTSTHLHALKDVVLYILKEEEEIRWGPHSEQKSQVLSETSNLGCPYVKIMITQGK